MQINPNIHLQKTNSSISFSARLPKLSPPEKNIIKNETPELIKNVRKKEGNINDFIPSKILFAGIETTTIVFTILSIAQLNFSSALSGLGIYLYMAINNPIKMNAIKSAKRLSKDLKDSGKYTDAQRFIIIDKYLQKSGDFIFTPLTRIFNKKEIMKIAQVNPEMLYKSSKNIKEESITPRTLESFSKIGWSKKETAKFINDINSENKLSDEKLIQIAKEVYEATTHLEKPLSNKIKSKIFRNAATPHSDDFDKLARQNNKHNTL